ncbi:MAG: integrase arm-type DNA-binding domain-containing protein [Thermodesulfobacteriota bacterium]
MPKRIVPLADVKIRTVKPAKSPQKLFDGGGLFLLVTPSGGKLWYFKYRADGKEKKLSFGSYPEVSLSEARLKREEARRQISQGIDPGAVKKAQKAAQQQDTETFEVITREWVSRKAETLAKETSTRELRQLEVNVFPWLGSRPIAEIKAPELLAVLRRIEDRGVKYTAHRMRSLCSRVFKFAVATGRAERDPAADLIGALNPYRGRHHAAIIEPKGVVGLLRAIDGYGGSFIVNCALRLAPLVFCRPGELRKMEWAAVDLEAAEWRYLVTKTETEHIVPLSRQAVAILKEIHPLTGSSPYVFPSGRTFDRPMSNNAINAALRRMGFDTKNEISGHGFRAMARTILDEVLGFRPELIEHQLAHAVRDPLGRAYNRTKHLPARRKMMQAWSDYLEALKAGAKIIPIKTASQE